MKIRKERQEYPNKPLGEASWTRWRRLLMAVASHYLDLLHVAGVAKLRVDGFEKVLGRLSMNKVLNGLATCYAYGGGGGQFNASYCNCESVMAVALYPLVGGSGSPLSSLPASLMDTRCSNQRGGNTSLPYKHFRNMAK